MAPMTPEAKAALLKRLAEGRSKTKAARAEAKEKGQPDPKPRKVRKDKKVKALDPMAHTPAREGAGAPRPIDAAKNDATNVVAAAPPDPTETVTSKIDVPNLPDKAGRKKIVDDPEVIAEAKGPKDLSTTGRTKKIDDNDLLVNKETGNQVITTMIPGQKESIKKVLKKNKTENTPEAPAPVPSPPEKTVKNVIHHIPDTKAIEAKAPFSFSAVRKMLYQ